MNFIASCMYSFSTISSTLSLSVKFSFAFSVFSKVSSISFVQFNCKHQIEILKSVSVLNKVDWVKISVHTYRRNWAVHGFSNGIRQWLKFIQSIILGRHSHVISFRIRFCGNLNKFLKIKFHLDILLCHIWVTHIHILWRKCWCCIRNFELQVEP